MMESFEKCVHVTDMSKVAYWREHEGFGLYDLEDCTMGVQPGAYAVWIQGDDGPVLTAMSEDEFNTRFVKEEDLPERFKDLLEAAPTYDEWCISTCNSEVCHDS
ncbi:MAG: hypothetical protein AB7E51_14920 [Pseudodesulfovibrio sp.]|uniref:hypothetical protein n=1 Tax=Pseudodesulfovibrio sp. TaxID=2035812 RepID=UPI003D12E2C1